jgi:hypothetical protein
MPEAPRGGSVPVQVPLALVGQGMALLRLTPLTTRSRVPAARGHIPGPAAFRINRRCGTLMRRAHYLLDGVGAQMSKKTMSVHCPVCNVSSPRELSELARPSGQSCLICGTFLSDYAWGELATALLAVHNSRTISAPALTTLADDGARSLLLRLTASFLSNIADRTNSCPSGRR